MENIFSIELQKHYIRNRNKIVFGNGMSLNQLALEMYEKLGFREIDVSVLSRVLKGERVLTQKQLSVFSKIMKLKIQEREHLKLSLHSEIYSRFEGRYLLDINTNQFIEMAENALLMIQKANENGASVLALHWAIDLEKRVKHEIMKELKINTINKLNQILFVLLEQHAISILRREMPDEAQRILKPLFEEMLKIAQRLKSREKLGLTYAKMGDVLSLVGAIHNSKSILAKSSKLLKKSFTLIDSKIIIYPLGCAMLNESYLKNNIEFDRLKNEVYKTIPFSNYSDACEAYNLIAKSKINIRQSNNLENDFISGWECFNKITETGKSSRVYRKVQLLRTEVQAAVSNYKFRNINELKKIITEGLFMSKAFGYERYFSTTKEMLISNQEFLKEDFIFSDYI